MEVKELKEKLHTLIESSSADTLEYMYSIFEESDYAGEFKKVLDEEYKAYQTDGVGDSRKEVDAMINSLLNK